ncbi:glycoside hydrolase family 19 protein, partial [Chromobacterium piscinae]|uniref:glycoside hydrolase family 19 protein n=1 Tax=Chromobacterium piscinae TaxID=686831 RepID=UPI00320B43D2
MSKKQTSHAAANNKTVLINAMLQAGIRDPKEQAMFLAQTAHESLNFSSMREGNYRTASNLLSTFKKRLNAQGITTEQQAQTLINAGQDKVYDAIYGGRMGNNKSGDGIKYRGRGFVQLTGRETYTAASQALKLDLVNHPELAEDPANAAKIAVWYWQNYKTGLATAARAGDVKQATQILNGGQNGYADRKAKYQQYLNQGPITTSSPAPLSQSTPSPSLITQHAEAAKPVVHTPPPQGKPQATKATESAAAQPATQSPHANQESILSQRGRFNGYKYLYGGNGQKDAKGVNRIDCSHLVNQALTGAGYAIPYQTTAGMANSKYYEEVDAKDVKPGDIALWQGNKNHTGIVEAYDAKTGKGSFFGAQSKKGASSAQMGKGAWWGQPQKFLRPKAEYRQSPPAAAAKPAQAKPAESKPVAAKPAAQPSAAQHAAQAAPSSQPAAGNSVQKLLKTEGTTRVYQMADGTVQTRTGGTVAWRNNNPGNLKFGYAGSHDKTDHSKRSKARALSDAQKRYQGVVDLDQWGNAIFADEATGRAAKAQLLTKQHGDKTIEQMLPKYAVSDYSGKANHAKYAEGIYQLAANRGLDLHGKKIKDLTHPEFEALMDGMKKVEGFKAGKVDVSGTA